MRVTGKHTQYGMESWFLVPKHKLVGLLPDGLAPFGILGLGTVVVGAWNHADAYVDDRSYGHVLEAWTAIGVEHEGRLYGYNPVTYNNNPAYAEPVNNIFKFTKVPAEMQWNTQGGRHEIEVVMDGVPVMRMAGRPTVVPCFVPFARPRRCWQIKGEERYVALMSIAAPRTRLAFCSVDIPKEGPLGPVADVIRGAARLSVFYTDASIEIPEPERYPTP